LLFVVIVLVYGIIAIHDIPARIARKRHHPHEDAIHTAGCRARMALALRCTQRQGGTSDWSTLAQ
jgi:hypothetical protein